MPMCDTTWAFVTHKNQHTAARLVCCPTWLVCDAKQCGDDDKVCQLQVEVLLERSALHQRRQRLLPGGCTPATPPAVAGTRVRLEAVMSAFERVSKSACEHEKVVSVSILVTIYLIEMVCKHQ